MQTFFRVRKEEKEAAYREMASWRKDHTALEAVREVEDLIEGALADRDRDDRLLRYVLKRAKGTDEQIIEEAYQFVRAYCKRSLLIHDLLREAIGLFGTPENPIKNAAALDKATQDYQTWEEDYPDLLIMSYEPVAKVLSERVQKALSGTSTESNWRELFTDDEDADTAN